MASSFGDLGRTNHGHSNLSSQFGTYCRRRKAAVASLCLGLSVQISRLEESTGRTEMLYLIPLLSVALPSTTRAEENL